MTKKNTSKQTSKTFGQKFNAKSGKGQAKQTTPVETVAAPEETVASTPAIEEEAAEPVEASSTEQTMLADETAAEETEASVESIAEQTMLADETLAQETAPEQITEVTPAQEETATSAPETTLAQSLDEAQGTAPEQAAEGTPETAATTEAAAMQSKVDPRLPPLGTLLRRTDRHGNVRCECTIEEAGFRYAGTLYKTLSAAAIVAAKDLGLKSETQNGFTFWNLSKPARRERPARNPLEGLERAWERYREHAQEAAKAEGEARAKAHEALHGHLNALFEITGKAAA